MREGLHLFALHHLDLDLALELIALARKFEREVVVASPIFLYELLYLYLQLWRALRGVRGVVSDSEVTLS